MNKNMVVSALATLALTVVPTIQAQQHKPYRIGVVHEGGPYNAAVEGLKDGLRERGLEPGKEVLLEFASAELGRTVSAEELHWLEVPASLTTTDES